MTANRQGWPRPAATLLAAAVTITGCTAPAREAGAIGTPDERERLFDAVLAMTRERESFSPVKNARLAFDPAEEMERFRQDVIAASTEEELYYALAKVSNARRDRHLRIGLVEGGLRLTDSTGVDQSNYPVPGAAIPHAPVRLAADYGTAGSYFLFVADVAEALSDLVPGDALPRVGERVVAVNGTPFPAYVDRIRPYHRYSTEEGFWWQLATWLPQRTSQFPPGTYGDHLVLELEGPGGDRHVVELPYLDPGTLRWEGHAERRYPGFRVAYAVDTYTLLRSETGSPVVLLQWNGFQDSLRADVDRLMAYAVEHDLLDAAVIVDATRSRGGSGGAYALRRLSPHPFRTTFGNLRISDASIAFARDRINRLRDRREFPAVPGDGDDGGWLLAWFEEDFLAAVERGDDYTAPVPFKLAHLPKESDGIVRPAEVHFRGPLTVWLSPYGGSHLDQFASMVADNGIGRTVGMPAGGYSNTWEWEEVLRLPDSERPLVSFMWSIGHTLRPNGEILEGNPAPVDEYVPVTRDNHAGYHALLLRRTLEGIAGR